MRSQPDDSPVHISQEACNFARTAYRALLVEVNLTPKPGLVDRHNTGAHHDMELSHFYRSARAIGVWLPRFIKRGYEDAALPATQQLARLRPLGMACENHMFCATGGINTHKGSIFSLGLLCAAFGRLQRQQRALNAEALCAETAAMCQGLVERELRHTKGWQTVAQRLFAAHKLSGARGAAESGFRLVVGGALPLYRQRLMAGYDQQAALIDSLLWLMAHNDDTNVASRGGINGVHWLRRCAAELLARGGTTGDLGLQRLYRFDGECIARNLSPGSSADLLIVTWLLAQLPGN